jgi:poly-gamma-glutamate synthesis protein (capsule biosynthesis protein)
MCRRRFLATVGSAVLVPRGEFVWAFVSPVDAAMPPDADASRRTTLLLCGDVMTGRGIDQILAHPSKPQLYEPYVRNALRYVDIAEEATGPIARPVDFAYVWGDALAELDRERPDARIVNLETAVTTAEDAWLGKGIHYRMHPANIGCLVAAGIDCCVLANNHVLDWGYGGLLETLDTLQRAGICTAGAGADREEADAPAIVDVADKRRVLVFAFGMDSAGVPREWAAAKNRAGVRYLADFSPSTADAIASHVAAVKRSGDIAIASIHWGGNWGYDVPRAQREFAHELVEHAGIDVVHGHSSHHAKGIEIHHDRPTLYACGDFLNDYEGVGGHESFRSDLALMHFPTFGPSGALEALKLVPTMTRHFRVNRARGDDVAWLAATLTREGRRLGTSVVREVDDTLVVRSR